MQRQGNTADIRFNLALQKAMAPVEDPIEETNDGAYHHGQKADETWGSGDRSESGNSGVSAKELLRMASKAERWSSEAVRNLG